jgi:3-keto-disaccharide hydrolase
MPPVKPPGPTMPESLSRLVLLAALLSACATAPADDAPWVPLFNGENLDGWIPKIRGYDTGVNFGNTFRVEDGLMTVSYDQYDKFDNRFGHLFYEKPFSHYRLRVEYRFIGDHAPGTEEWGWRNSGAMIHSQSPQSMLKEQDFPISLEAQLLGGLVEGERRPTANLCTPGTHVYYEGHFEDEHCIWSTSETYYGDQWVTVEVLVEGDKHFVHYVNGDPVIEYTHAMTGGEVVHDFNPALKPERAPLGKGYISLQSEGHPIQFRRVEIQVLDGNDSSVE